MRKRPAIETRAWSGLQSRIGNGGIAWLATSESRRQERDHVVVRLMRAGQRHRAASCRASQGADRIAMGRRQQVEAREGMEQIVPLHRREILEEGRPGLRLVKPTLPVLIELILKGGREMPERHASRRIE